MNEDRRAIKRMARTLVKIDQFEKKWIDKIDKASTDVISIRAARGEKKVYVFDRATVLLARFEEALHRLNHQIEALDKGEVQAIRKRSRLPAFVRECIYFEVKIYQAYNVRSVSRMQARAFMRGENIRLPKGVTEFQVRSVTGGRYKLLTETTSGRTEKTLGDWAVVVCVPGFRRERKVTKVIPRLTLSKWAKLNKKRVLLKKGKSTLLFDSDDEYDEELLLPLSDR